MEIFDHMTAAEVGEVINAILKVLVIAWAARVTIKTVRSI